MDTVINGKIYRETCVSDETVVDIVLPDWSESKGKFDKFLYDYHYLVGGNFCLIPEGDGSVKIIGLHFKCNTLLGRFKEVVEEDWLGSVISTGRCLVSKGVILDKATGFKIGEW